MPALLEPSISAFLTRERALLFELSRGLGPSVHYLFPEIFTANIRRFQGVLRDAAVRHEVLFAMKVNRCACFLETCGARGFGIDAASYEELREALAAGVGSRQICVSGPQKPADTLILASRVGALVAVDSLEELKFIGELWSAGRLSRPLQILLRWKGVTPRQSRFGLSEADLHVACNSLQGAEHLVLRGLSFHLGGYDLEQRARSLSASLDKIADLRANFDDCDTVDIGGGYSINYVARATWERFSRHGGTDTGPCYPGWARFAKHDSLQEILAWRDGTRPTLSDRLRRDDVYLLLEPGRAALDQAGLSVFRVNGAKRGAGELYTVNLAGNSLSLSERWFDCEVHIDPILIGASEIDQARRPVAATITGASCLEDDVFSMRRVRLTRVPRPGDLLAYANTAPYQMDFAETAIHRAKLPAKVVIESEGGRPVWRCERGPGHG